MNVLYVASECAPFVKTGGLADVVGAVPKALAEIGVHVKVALPAYPALKAHLDQGNIVEYYDDLHGGPARLVAVEAANLDLLLLDAPHLFDRPGNIYLDRDGTVQVCLAQYGGKRRRLPILNCGPGQSFADTRCLCTGSQSR